MVTMILAATRPISRVSEGVMRKIANASGGSLTAWWLTILTLGPLRGSFIVTEPAAMTIAALQALKDRIRTELLKRRELEAEIDRIGPEVKQKLS